ncbi:MAG: hypothetical protein D6725_06475 [Planctomycetota bacterium]|nr:MAG: hypothetical protein D6725_06475 [Planctomycetota bacterium]
MATVGARRRRRRAKGGRERYLVMLVDTREPMQWVEAKSILTRTSGYLKTVTSHSLQPYVGCALGGSLCGVGCYARHNVFVTQGRSWGRFLVAKQNAADLYRRNAEREARWARRHRGAFSVFLSSATEPFPPQEPRAGVTEGVLRAMLQSPPDELVVQTHSCLVVGVIGLLRELSACCRLRVHVSIESDRDALPGLPRSAYTVRQRLDACRRLRDGGLFVVVTVAPLLPIRDPKAFFRALREVADAVVVDHFVEGDGTPDGRRTWKTALPKAMEAVLPRSTGLAYRDEIVEAARQWFDGPVGVGRDGFAGRFRFD